MGDWHIGRVLLVFALAISVATPIAAPAAQVENGPAEPPAPQPSAEVKQLLDAARQFSEAEQYQQALQAAEQAVELSRQTADLAGMALAQQARGEALVELSRKQEAVAALRAAAEAWEKVGDGPGQVQALAWTGAHSLELDPDGGNAVLARALRLGQEETRRPLAVSAALRDGCDQLYYLEKYAEAGRFCSAALALREQLVPDSLLLAESLFDMGWTISWTEPIRMEEYFRRSLEIRQRLAPGSPELAHTLMGLAGAATERADYPTALDYNLRALEILDTLGPGFEFRKATALHNLGMDELLLGDFRAAENHLRRAVEIQGRLSTQPKYGVGRYSVYLSRLGNVRLQQGDLDGAEELYRRALLMAKALGRPTRQTTGQILNYLGRLMLLRRNLPAAKEFLQEALGILENLQGADGDLADTLQLLGSVALEQGNLGSAEAAYRHAIALLERMFGQAHPYVAPAVVGLATVHANTGETTQALELALRAEQSGRAQAQLTAQSLSEREALLYSATRPSGLDVLLTLSAGGTGQQIGSVQGRGRPEEVKQ